MQTSNPTSLPAPQPSSLAELAELIRSAHATQTPPGNIDLSKLSRLLRHRPEDMTVSAESGMTLGALQQHLQSSRQWIPIDPAFPDQLTLHDLLAWDLSGPRRLGFGTVRDFVIGLTVVPGDGRPYRSGGQVVKNVAGFDLMKLVIGAQSSLGIIADITFKVLPIPEREAFLCQTKDCPSQFQEILNQLASLPIQPSVLDLSRPDSGGHLCTLTIGFSGAIEDVDWQVSAAAQFGFQPCAAPTHEEQFYRRHPRPSVRRTSVLPSRLPEACAHFPRETPFIGRVANGSIYHPQNSTPGPFATPKIDPSLLPVLARLKNEFDPARLFPPIPA